MSDKPMMDLSKREITAHNWKQRIAYAWEMLRSGKLIAQTVVKIYIKSAEAKCVDMDAKIFMIPINNGEE